MRRELVRGCPVSRYEQFEISPETIEQELRPANSDRFKENYSIDVISCHFG